VALHHAIDFAHKIDRNKNKYWLIEADPLFV